MCVVVLFIVCMLNPIYTLNTDSMPSPPSCSQKAHRHLLLLLTLFLATFLKGSKVPAEDTAVTSLE